MIRQNYFNMYRPNTSNAIEDTKCISTFVDQTPPIPSRTQNLSQHVLTKPILCQQEHKIYLKMRWQNKSHCSEDIKYISIGVWQTPPMPAMIQNVSQNILINPILYQRGHKIYLNMSGTNPYHGSKNSKCIQHVLTKPLPCQRGHKIYLNMFWITPPVPAGTPIGSQQVLSKPIPCQRGLKMHLTQCWPNPSHASEDTKCISTCVDQMLPCQQWDKMYLNMSRPTHPMLARIQNASPYVLTKRIPCHQRQNTYL